MATGHRSPSRTARRIAAGVLAAASLSIVATAQASALVTDAPARTLPAAVSLSATKIAPTAASSGSDLDSWIREALGVMAAHGIPGSYDGIHRNIMRESGGDPGAINLYDSNAAAGIPSKGLLQVIDPTFQAYHVDGTSWDIWDPVANITAACNYAAARYGSMDNVDSAY
ncbi:transglycosylase SLT domain-containing protein [Nocardia sp. NPDC004582]